MSNRTYGREAMKVVQRKIKGMQVYHTVLEGAGSDFPPVEGVAEHNM